MLCNGIQWNQNLRCRSVHNNNQMESDVFLTPNMSLMTQQDDENLQTSVFTGWSCQWFLSRFAKWNKTESHPRLIYVCVFKLCAPSHCGAAHGGLKNLICLLFLVAVVAVFPGSHSASFINTSSREKLQTNMYIDSRSIWCQSRGQ